MMVRLLVLVLVGVVLGSVSGASWGSEGQILGASSGLVMAVGAWLLTNTVRRALYEYRINRHFDRETYLEDRADHPR